MMRAGERANLSRVSCGAVPHCLTLHRPGLDRSGPGAAQILARGPAGGLEHRTRLIIKRGFLWKNHECSGLVRDGAVAAATGPASAPEPCRGRCGVLWTWGNNAETSSRSLQNVQELQIMPGQPLFLFSSLILELFEVNHL